jgi:uncharacterized Zn-binding protein involved in type VI secretion
MTDGEGKESIIISTKKGQIRFAMSAKGIEIINEIGDVRIKCRKLKIAGESGTAVQAGKKLQISAETINIKGKNIKIDSGKDIKLKANNIRLNCSKGITTEGKQMAAEGDKVAGFDIHKMVVPSGSGTSVVPLPHPYLGKLVEGLSNNVKINGHNAATKGSISKHDHPVHNQLPGTIKFEKNPAKEGEVTNGTGKKVKINGKEAAVVGSTVTTCNDTGAKDNSVIMAPGASMPMPVIINPKNTESYLKEREARETRHPEFTQAQWGKAQAKEGEEIELTASVKDIDDKNMVTFQVWKEGQDPNANIPQAQIPAAIEGGTAKAKWKYRYARQEAPPEEDPKFYFSAHSAWCPFKKSGMATVQLKRPELSNPGWKDGEGKSTDKGLVGEPLKLSVSCNADMEEGAGVVFKVYPEGANTKWDAPVAELDAANKGGTAEAEWAYHYAHDEENPLTEKPKFFFVAEGRRCKEAKSGNAEIGQTVTIEILTEEKEPAGKVLYKLYFPDDSCEEQETAEDGIINKEDLIPGIYHIEIREKDEQDGSERRERT